MAHNLKFIYLLIFCFVKLKNILCRSCLTALLAQTWQIFHRAGTLNALYRVVHFSNRHACVIFWTHRWPATGNSKPDSPYQPACVRSVTSGLRSVCLCTASASWCWINGWNVRQKLDLCLFWRHVHTEITWSPWLPFMISFFICAWCRTCILKTSWWRWQHVQPLRVHMIQNTGASIVVQRHQQAAKLMWSYKWILNWYDDA